MEKLSSGLASGGDMRLDIAGKRDMLGGYADDFGEVFVVGGIDEGCREQL